VLVADDAHLLPQASIDLLSSRLEEDPGSLRLVVMTRQQIGLPLVVLRLHGSAQHLTHADLAFDHRETAELVGLIAPDLTPDAVYRLDELTRGWAGPLVMSARAEAAAGRGGATHTAMLLGTDFLEHLLADEWDALPPAVRHTLLATCQESDIGPVAAALLTGDLEASAHLAELAASGTLVGSTVMADGPAWRVHPLLRELMRRWTAPGGAHVDVVVAAHARAARGYAARNDPAPALRHARLSGEPALVVDVLTEYGPSLLCAARTDEVSEAFVALPATVCEQPHVLAIDALLRRANGDVNGAARTAARAAANAVGVEADLALRADLALLGVWQGRYGWTDVRAAIRTATDILGCHHGDESHHALQGLSLVRSAWLMIELAAAQAWTGDLSGAEIHVRDGLVAARSLQHHRLIAAGLAHRAMLETIGGSFQTAAETARETLAEAATAGVSGDPYIGRAHLALGWAAFHELQMRSARDHLARVEAAPSAMADPLLVVMAALLRARLLAEDGCLDAAHRVLTGRLEIPEPIPLFLRRLLGVVRGQTAMMAGDAEALRLQINDFRALGLHSEAQILEAFQRGMGGEPGAAVEMLDLLIDGEPTEETVAVGARALRLALCLRAGDLDRAQALVPDLLARAAPQRMLHLLTVCLVARTRFLRVLRDEATRDGGHPWAQAVFDALSGQDRQFGEIGPPGDAAGRGAVFKVADTGVLVTLTPRELDVLGQLALGGSYADISQALYVTENTVKTHVASIYRRLGADRRATALSIARDHGLV
jgi:ATP/maltotriose-dependent transcriptional regulator MalT